MAKTPKIVGDGWELTIDRGYNGWDMDGIQYDILKMVNSEFPPERIVESYENKHTITWGTTFGPLYEDTIAFLRKWGVKCEGVDIPEMSGERGPYDENNPPPAN